MHCGHPTSHATNDEWQSWELGQWRARDLHLHVPSESPHAAEPWPLEAPAPAALRIREQSYQAVSNPPAVTDAQPEGIEIDLRTSNASALVRGRSRGRSATLLVDRAVVILDRAGSGRKRWMPLEEIDAIKPSGTTLIIESTAEQIRLECRDPGAITRAARILTAAEAEARLGHRHDPDVMQAWCELTSALWKGPLSRHRIKARQRSARRARLEVHTSTMEL